MRTTLHGASVRTSFVAALAAAIVAFGSAPASAAAVPLAAIPVVGAVPGALAATPTTTSVTSPPSDIDAGTPTTIRGTVVGVPGGADPTGSVAVAIGASTVTVPVVSGGFSAVLTPTRGGAQLLAAAFTPVGAFEPSAAVVSAVAVHSPTLTGVTGVTTNRIGTPVVLRVGITTTTGATVSGTVVASLGSTAGTSVGASALTSAPVVAGAATLTIPAATVAGTRTLTVSYGGSGLVRGSSTTLTLTDAAAPPVPPTPVPTPTTTPVPTAKPTPVPTAPPAGEELAKNTVTTPTGTVRFAGEDRVATSLDATRRIFAGRTDHVLVGSTTTFADSIAGARLAASLSAPLLLTSPTSLSAATAAEIKRVAAPGATVVVLGGEAVVGPTVLEAIKALDASLTIRRISGANRFETAVAIAAETKPAPGSPIYLVSGMNFPDGLATSPLAAVRGGIVLLTDGSTMHPSTAAYLAAQDPGGKNTVAVGGPASAAAPTAGRKLVGADRYATAALVVGEFASAKEVRGLGVALGRSWPDALVGAAAMARIGGPLVLTDGGALDAGTVAAAKVVKGAHQQGMTAGLVFGGQAVVGPRVMEQMDEIL